MPREGENSSLNSNLKYGQSWEQIEGRTSLTAYVSYWGAEGVDGDSRFQKPGWAWIEVSLKWNC